MEAAATGAATVAVPLAPNQRPNARALEQAGAAVIAEPGDVVAAVGELDREALAAAGQRAVDGYGALRIAWRLAQLITCRNSSSSRVTSSGWSSARK